MSGRGGWIERREGASATVARAAGGAGPTALARDGWPAPEARDADLFRVAVAHQVRQDLWRALRAVRGFAPVVTVTSAPGRVEVEAGGRLLSGAAARARVAETAAALLADEARRRRWTRFALARAGGPAR